MQLVNSNHLNLAEVELLISPSNFEDPSHEGDIDYDEVTHQQTMEILSNGEHVGMDVDMNGPAGGEEEPNDGGEG